jgi:hypothetical protein
VALASLLAIEDSVFDCKKDAASRAVVLFAQYFYEQCDVPIGNCTLLAHFVGSSRLPCEQA